MHKIIYSTLLILVLIFANIQYSFSDYPVSLNIPPTNAFDKIHTDNGTVNARNFSMPLNIKSGSGVSVTSNNVTHTVIISSNSSTPALQVVDIYDTAIGDYSGVSVDVASSFCCGQTVLVGSNYTNPNSHTAGWTGKVFVVKLTGMTIGASFNTVGLNVATASGNVRVKVYKDDGSNGQPSTLIAESNSIAVGGTGIQNFTLTSSGTVPNSGNVWAGFETDNALFGIYYTTPDTTGRCSVTHTYGTGPSPFGSCTVAGDTAEVKLFNIATGTHTADKAIDSNTSTYWESLNEIHPYIYLDTGVSGIITASAIYWNSSSTTTQILVQTSTDAISWNTKRTINTNLLIDKSWNYIRWTLDPTFERYVRFYGNDGTAKQLSFYELKLLGPGAATLLIRHGHLFIDPANPNLPLNK